MKDSLHIPTTRPKVLIIDDEEDLCTLLCLYLKSRGYIPIQANSMAAGRRMLENAGCDLVVLDINLGDGNGLDLIREKAIPEETPVVVMSARAELKAKAEELGARRFVNKPFSSLELLNALEDIRQVS